MTTHCSFCGRNIEEPEHFKKYLTCHHCHMLVPMGANSYVKYRREEKEKKKSRTKLNKKEVKMEEQKAKTVVKKEKSSVQKYDDAFKKEVVALVKTGMSYKEVSKKYNGSPNAAAIKRWCNVTKK